LPPRQGSGEQVSKGFKVAEQDLVRADEEYVMVTTAVNMPMYVNHDQAAFKRWGSKWA
jgi:ribose transport system substrate-binding protein